MTDEHLDVRDLRGRAFRIALAVALAGGVTALVMRAIRAVSGAPNRDPVGGSMVGLVAILVFVLTAFVLGTYVLPRAHRVLARRRA